VSDRGLAEIVFAQTMFFDGKPQRMKVTANDTLEVAIDSTPPGTEVYLLLEVEYSGQPHRQASVASIRGDTAENPDRDQTRRALPTGITSPAPKPSPLRRATLDAAGRAARMRLHDKVALVTGGGSGIGRAIALRFAAEGAQVVVNDLTAERAETTVKSMVAGQGRAIAADVSDSVQVRAMFAAVERELGRLDVLVNNAGIGLTSDEHGRLSQVAEARIGETLAGEVKTHWDVTVNMTDATWRRMLAVHLDGTFYCTREALRLMNRANRGVIINLSSAAALTGLDTAPHYCAAKGGILSFTRALAREVGSRGIRVNAICPGYIDTPMTAGMSPLVQKVILSRTPLGRWGEPEEVAATALFLASDESSFYTGQWLSPNGGLVIGG
jgi:3-oxoacyl-[acyl-carrier protein] reductase